MTVVQQVATELINGDKQIYTGQNRLHIPAPYSTNPRTCEPQIFLRRPEDLLEQ